MANGIQPEELIAEYCNLDAVLAALLRADAAAIQTELGKTMQNFLEEDADDETLSLLVNCLFVVLQYHVFYRFLDEIKLTLGDTYAARAAMRRDWENWKNNAPMDTDSWLDTDDETAKIRVLQAIDLLGLTADDFDEILAPEMKEPKRLKKSFGMFDLVTIADAVITDDGGLAAQDDPAGKSYVLKDADGVTYYLNGLRKSDVPGGLHPDEERLYTADGWIDGYTSKELREIELEIYDGGFIFTYANTDTDDAAFEQNPRWMAYEIWVNNRIAKRRATQAAFLAKYK